MERIHTFHSSWFLSLSQDYNETVKNPYANGQLPVSFAERMFRYRSSVSFIQKGNWMCSMSSQTAKTNTAVNKDIVEKLQAMADLYGKTNGMFSAICR